MKKITLLFVFIFVVIASHAQWSGGTGDTNPIFRTGNVGIGTPTPSQKLEVNGAILSTSNFGLMIAPASGDAVIKRANSGNLMISSNGGTNDVRINYSYGGGSGGLSIYDGGSINNANLSVNPSGNLSIYSNGGKVGIGTITPADQLEIVSGNRKVGFNALISGVSNGGMISISRPDDGAKTMLIGTTAAPSDDNVIFSQGGSTELRLVSNGGPYATAGFGFYNNISDQSAFGSARPTPVMKIDGNGNVGIGTTVPDAKLAVKGQIHAQEVRVDLNGAIAPDYVFEKDYALPSLESVKIYIDQNKHLPEVPSAKEMEANGINLSEMNMLLLKKVEELTLYILKQEEKFQSQDARLAEVESLLNKLNQIKEKQK